MKRRYVVLIIALAVCYFLAGMHHDKGAASTYSAKPDGVKALFLLIEEQGSKPRRWYYPFANLSSSETNATLFLVSPEKLSGEKDLLNWVSRGNRLIYFESPLSRGDEFQKLLHIREGDAYSQKIKEMLFEKNELPFHCFVNETTPDVCANVKSVSEPQQKFLGLNYSLRIPLEADVLIGDRDNPRAFYLPYERGSIWYFVGSEPIVNKNIDAVDNARLFFQLATVGSHTYFDEFHHGYTAPLSGEVKRHTALIYLFLSCLLIWCLFGALSRAVRFGNAIPAEEFLASSSTDFVRALGTLYFERNASSILAKYLVAWRLRVKSAFGISEKFSSGQLAAEMVYQGIIREPERERYIEALQTLESLGTAEDKEVMSAISSLEMALRQKARTRKIYEN